MVEAAGNIKLYSTKYCHLCEQAEEVLHRLGINVIKIDIADSDELFDRYSLRIPVLQRLDNKAELDWPFDTARVSDFLAISFNRAN